jgi:A/G-specific adenine glycosylase
MGVDGSIDHRMGHIQTDQTVQKQKVTFSGRTGPMFTSNMRLSREQVLSFQKTIHDYYKEHGRDLPWRRTDDPYHILVSEIMLQQTQVERVIGKYEAFIAVFPDFPSLAGASLTEVMDAWHGLGYNRRARSLLQIGREVMARHKGTLPADDGELAALPGIGPTTAGAILAFAFHISVPFIETNIRRVFIHWYFQEREKVSDREIMDLVEQTLDREDPKVWYYALMDYGSMLGREIKNPNRKSTRYRKQGPFEDSDRKIRGAIIGMLLKKTLLSESDIQETTGESSVRIRKVLLRLEKERLIEEEEGKYRIP